MSRTAWCKAGSLARRLGTEEQAATATEYAVMLALILMTCLGAVQIFGGGLSRLFVDINTTLFNA